MSARGMFFGEGPTACPFVALESDRDRRSDEPDHRHRCYAEPDPAPRALAHQREYCLAAAFTACPIFQDWAIRAAATPVPLRPGRMQDSEREEQPVWAAPPPWLGEAGDDARASDDAQAAGHAPASDDAQAAEIQPALQPTDEGFAQPSVGPADESAGLIPPPVADREGAIERIPSRMSRFDDWPERESPGRPEEADVPPFLADRAGPGPGPDRGEQGRPEPRGEPEAHEHRAEHDRREARRVHVPRSREEREAQRDEIIAPWQRGAVQATRSRINMPSSGDLLSKLTTLLAIGFILALAVAAIIIAPSLLGGGGDPGATLPAAGASPTAPTATVTPRPQPTPSPSPRTYTVQAGDTLFAIARRHGLTVEQLLGANPQVTNPNVVTIGQVLFIPDDDFGLFSPSPSP